MSREENGYPQRTGYLPCLPPRSATRAVRACRAGRRGAEHRTADGNHGAHRGRPRQITRQPPQPVAGPALHRARLGRRRSRGLAYLDEMTVRIADVGADFVPVVLWLGEEPGAPGRPVPVRLGDVPDPEVKEPAGDIRVGGRSKPDGRLVIGR